LTFYPYTLLLHIVGVIGLFVALSLELVVVSRLRAAKMTTQVHEWLTLNRVIDLVLPISAVFILVSGLVLLFSGWGWGHAWIELSLGLLVLLGILGPVINGPRMKAIHVAAQAAPVGEISYTLSLPQQKMEELAHLYTHLRQWHLPNVLCAQGKRERGSRVLLRLLGPDSPAQKARTLDHLHVLLAARAEMRPIQTFANAFEKPLSAHLSSHRAFRRHRSRHQKKLAQQDQPIWILAFLALIS
jgi:uncharacterized membrane protein